MFCSRAIAGTDVFTQTLAMSLVFLQWSDRDCAVTVTSPTFISGRCITIISNVRPGYRCASNDDCQSGFRGGFFCTSFTSLPVQCTGTIPVLQRHGLTGVNVSSNVFAFSPCLFSLSVCFSPVLVAMLPDLNQCKYVCK